MFEIMIKSLLQLFMRMENDKFNEIQLHRSMKTENSEFSELYVYQIISSSDYEIGEMLKFLHIYNLTNLSLAKLA